MKFKILLFLICNYSICFSQDILIKVNGDSIPSNIIKISTDNITFKKDSNLDGPEYAVRTDSVYKIVFQNSKEEFFNVKAIERKEIIKHPEDAVKKGNNIYITYPDAVSEKGEEYFVDNMKYWGYWNIVEVKSKAHFIIEFTIEKRPWGFFRGWATLKTVDGVEFKKTETFKSTANAWNGWNVAKEFSKELVDDYFKEEFR
jgi:hypothetical protein